MFSFFNVEIPNEVVENQLLLQLPLEDIIAFRRVSKGAKAISERYAVRKQIIHYLFERGVHLLCGARNDDDNKKLLQRATKYLSIAKSLLEQLGTPHLFDEPWVNFMLGYIYISGYGLGIDPESEADDTAKPRVNVGMEKLKSSAAAGHTNAKLLLADIYMQHPLQLSPLFRQPLYMANNLSGDFFDDNSKTAEGVDYLISAYDLNENETELMRAGLLESKPTLFDVLNLLSAKGDANCALALANLAFETLQPNRLTKALKFYKQASAQGNLSATLLLVYFYATGSLQGQHIKTPTPFDINNAIDCLKLATTQGSSHAAFCLGTFYLTGSCTLGHGTTLKNPDKPNINAALKCFMRGTKDIKDFNFQAAGKCAFALASHYHKEGNLKKTFECYKKGSELGHFKCTLEAGYLCLHYHAELGLLNGLKTAEHYFNDAHMLKPDKAESPAVTSMTSATPFPKPTEDIIANFLISHDDVEKHQDANLQQYIKWKLQAFASGHRDAIIDLRDLFQEPGQKFTGDIPLTIRPSSLLDKNESSIFADPIIKPFNITICNPELAQLIHTIYSDDNCSPEAIVDLAKRCYEALGLTVIEDERLVELANQTYVTTSKLQIEKISKR